MVYSYTLKAKLIHKEKTCEESSQVGGVHSNEDHHEKPPDRQDGPARHAVGCPLHRALLEQGGDHQPRAVAHVQQLCVIRGLGAVGVQHVISDVF